MTFLRSLVAAGFCLSTAATGIAATVASDPTIDAFRTRAKNYAVQVNPHVFEVTGRPGALAEEVWCAAADYARRGLGLDWHDHIYVARGYGKGLFDGAPSSVLFTTDPAAAGITPQQPGLIASRLAVGYGRSIGLATGDCKRLKQLDED